MNKEFVPYEQALELKELGFDEPCLKLWEKTILFTSLVNPEEFKKVISERYASAPLYQQAFRWFREKHGMVFNLVGSGPYYPSIAFILIDGNSDIELGEYKSYEEAELACLKQLIEIIKNK
jgi:hypothetical protein